MRAWFIYRMRARTPGAFIAAIARNAGQIKRPNSWHSYFHLVVHVCRYEGDERIVGHSDADFDTGSAFWSAYRTEADVLAAVHDRRRQSLFGIGIAGAPPTPYSALMDELRERYAMVRDRESERALLREGEARLSALGIGGKADPLPIWKWTKRHTSPTSFPFLRPGIDVYKAEGFDLHGNPVHPRWYAIVSFHY